MRRNKRKETMRKRQILKISVAAFILMMIVTLTFSVFSDPQEEYENDFKTGIWLAYGDFAEVGLYNRTETDFRNNASAFFEKAEGYGIDTVFFHTRAFRDAAYISDNFPMASYIWDRNEPISYDPLKVMIEIAHEYDMKLHAWLNPFRNTSFDGPVMDPAEDSTKEEILLCVGEILDNYDVDGIHFDDYFYEESDSAPANEKMENVNGVVRAVYKKVHDAGRDLVFGISPAGNIPYCESIGADVKTWMSEKGYVDYIVPQIYWTDQHTATWREKMFSDTLDEWCKLNKLEVPMYIGLALYKAGTEDPEDRGWSSANDNLAFQVQQIYKNGCEGYVFFSAGDLYRESANVEMENYRNLVF